ncbi:thiamine pyrophosphate-dependent dehydrogenase E1 component subunit alpha [Paenibacillus abyssi]|uniref:2-oxoisovalerate dehydrogenase subunit alpha n=1 Tax=Paenibacillus abyssi TaxID=1340531 RepID=A0A917CFU2_9BACL|nr:thiamine pyrophosphate-dependent dehydrogenase E1 component subunit alpha [Paenibacillus abyssi]GGF87262.1 2-oxoisovalerate dehydrogenase subunit alpha [Paenibacillus abyssi]
MTQSGSVRQTFKHNELGLSDEQAVEMYATMLMARSFDERCMLLQRAGKINFHVSGIGQEAAQVAAAFALDRENDYFLPYYRDYGLVLAAGMTLRELMLSVFAKAEDPNSGGRQMPGHFGSKRLRIVTGSSPVTTQVPHAVGLALAAKMKGKPFVTFVTFGDGSSNQGDFHEGCNFAGVHKLPVIFMCENNRYAISTPIHRQVAGRISDRALGYGFPGIEVDGNDALEVYRVVKEARARGMAGEGPTLIDAQLYRLSPHSTSDNDLIYRTKEEVDEHRSKDGLPRYKQYLIECGIWDEEQDQALQKKLREMLDDATSYGDKAPFPAPEDTLLYVYGDQDGKGGQA